jgi:hypothetical protein
MKHAFLPLLGALALAACASPQQYSAADDIHAFLTAVRDNNRPLFNAHVDRDALALQLEGRILRELPSDPVARGLGMIMAGPVSEAATSLLAQPRVFRAVAVHNGYDPSRPLPNKLLIAQVLRNAGAGRVCVGDAKNPCTLVFARVDGAWKLTAFEGDLRELRAS